MLLTDLPKGASAIVDRVEHTPKTDMVANRLRDLGFVEGEPVRVVARGRTGAGPILVVIGSTRFALRRAEADRVFVRDAVNHG